MYKKKELKRLFFLGGGEGVSLTSYFSTDKILVTGYDIYLFCAIISDHVTLPAISLLHFWAAGRS